MQIIAKQEVCKFPNSNRKNSKEILNPRNQIPKWLPGEGHYTLRSIDHISVILTDLIALFGYILCTSEIRYRPNLVRFCSFWNFFCWDLGFRPSSIKYPANPPLPDSADASKQRRPLRPTPDENLPRTRGGLNCEIFAIIREIRKDYF